MVCSAMTRSRHAGSTPASSRAQQRGSRYRASTATLSWRRPASGDLLIAAAYSVTANSATSGHPSPPTGNACSCHPSAGPTNDSAELIDANTAEARITSRAASSSTRRWTRA